MVLMGKLWVCLNPTLVNVISFSFSLFLFALSSLIFYMQLLNGAIECKSTCWIWFAIVRLLVLSIYLAAATFLTWSFVPHFLKLMIQLSSQVSCESIWLSCMIFSAFLSYLLRISFTHLFILCPDKWIVSACLCCLLLTICLGKWNTLVSVMYIMVNMFHFFFELFVQYVCSAEWSSSLTM